MLFDARGNDMPGKEGCSKYFMLGVLEVPDPVLLTADLERLRAELLADPYFQGVPSMQVEQKKTAWAFHAKDDIPEVRREVFRLLLMHNVKFFAVVRDKMRVLDQVRQHNLRDVNYRYRENDLYDTMVSRLFKDRLHQTAEVNVCFASRGKSDRSRALDLALDKAHQRFNAQWKRKTQTVILTRESSPARDVPLQAADYFLWALQRQYERKESRYLDLVWPKVALVHAVDETETAAYGVYYTKKKPLTKDSG